MGESKLTTDGTTGAGSSASNNKILIIGAGKSQLTGKDIDLSIQANIPYVVYERNASPTSRTRDWNMGLHWALPALKSLIPPALFARLQSTQVDPNTPTKPAETLRFLNGKTGETMGEAHIEGFYRLRRSKIRNLLTEGLDVRWGKEISNITYSSDGAYVTAHFADGTSDTGSLLVGADGPRSSIRNLLLGEEKSKTTNIDYAATMCFTKYTRDQALFLRSAPFHPLFQCAPHPDGYFAWLGLHDAPNPNKPEDWIFFAYISFFEPPSEQQTKSQEKTSPKEYLKHQKQLARNFADPFKSAFEWMSEDDDDGGTKVWFGNLNHWDPEADGHGWDNYKGRVTLVGDAAHPMTFQRGQGLNHALTDAANLVGVVEGGWCRGGGGGGDGGVNSGGVDEEAGFLDGIQGRKKLVDAFEAEVRKRGGEEVRLGEINTRMLHDWERVLASPVMRKGLGRDGR
ncbi:MAG: hypothetical protein M1812_006241 [Candelaria pacifica]|nr:MAG: hypothetical protein M1812_006241 [Candelaria pacifica]